jgi:hypothetical protein
MLGFGRVFDVCRRDGDTALALLGCLVDRTIVKEGGEALLGLSLCDGGCEGGLYLLVVDWNREVVLEIPFRDQHGQLCLNEVRYLGAIKNHSGDARHTDIHMGLGTLERSSIRADGINSISAPERMLQWAYSIALLRSSSCSPQKWNNCSREGRHPDPI